MYNVLTKIRGRELILIILMLLFITRYLSFIPIRNLSSSPPLELNNFIVYNYLLNAALLMLKTVALSFFIIIGSVVFNIQISFKEAVKSNLWANIIYLLPYLLFIGNAMSSSKGFDFSEIYNQSFLKFGNLLHFSDNGVIGRIFFNFNIFDIAFLLMLIIVISVVAKISKKEASKLVITAIFPVYILSPIFLLLLSGM